MANIEAFIIGWNEVETIHLTIKHYQKFCDRITFYDNYSDDGTDEVVSSMGCTVVKFGIKGVLSDKEYLKIKNFCWKRSRADYVIVCDSDEILQEPKNPTGTIIKTQGFNIFSHNMPQDDFFEIQTGILDNNYSKSVMFSPKLNEIGYVYGCHEARPKGDVVYSDETLWLLHYRNIGGPQRLIDRHKIYRKRMSAHNMELKLGIHYLYEDERREREWNEHYNRSKELSMLGGFL